LIAIEKRAWELNSRLARAPPPAKALWGHEPPVEKDFISQSINDEDGKYLHVDPIALGI